MYSTTEESFSVLCSVDILKMKSSFYHDVLVEQENNLDDSDEEHLDDFEDFLFFLYCFLSIF